MYDKPLISIIVPVYNQPQMTISCFRSVARQFTIPYEIIWVDNASKQENFDMIHSIVVKDKIQCNLIKNTENLGFVKATNQGIRESRGDFVLLLNNDTEVGCHLDQQMISPLFRDPTIGGVGPVSQSDLGWQGISGINKKFGFSLPNYNGKVVPYSEKLYATYKNKYLQLDGTPLYFFCTMFRKTTFEKIGLLNEEFGIGLGDDDEMNLRLRYAGFHQLLSLGSFCFHNHRTTFKEMKVDIAELRRHNVPIIHRVAKELQNKVDAACKSP